MATKVYELARREADSLREALAIEEYPIDLAAIADRLEADVEYEDLGSEVSGLVDKSPEKSVAQVLVNSTHTRQRQRFTLAHELGHLVERSVNDDEEYSFVEYRGREYNLHEFFADEFAGALLMPESEINRLTELGYSNIAMAAHFDVSVPALKMRRDRLQRQPS